jgi:hypothetical protein
LVGETLATVLEAALASSPAYVRWQAARSADALQHEPLRRLDLVREALLAHEHPPTRSALNVIVQAGLRTD